MKINIEIYKNLNIIFCLFSLNVKVNVTYFVVVDVDLYLFIC